MKVANFVIDERVCVKFSFKQRQTASEKYQNFHNHLQSTPGLGRFFFNGLKQQSTRQDFDLWNKWNRGSCTRIYSE